MLLTKVARIGLLSSCTIVCLAQGNEAVQLPLVESQKLGGIVRAADQPMQNVHVEECDEGWKHVIASTITDANGHFHLTPVGKGPMHYLRVYAPGFDISEYPVRLSRFAHRELQLVIQVGT